jgi:hypothetical protein
LVLVGGVPQVALAAASLNMIVREGRITASAVVIANASASLAAKRR